MHSHLANIGGANGSYSTDSPDLPGSVATGRTREETGEGMREAIAFHREGLRGDGIPVPDARVRAAHVAV